MSRFLAPASMLALLLAACATRPAPSPARTEAAPRSDAAPTEGAAERRGPSAGDTTAPGGASPASPSATLAPTTEPAPPTSSLQCRMTVSETEGCTPAAVESWVAPARRRIEECAGAKGGKVRVRLRSSNGKLTFDVEPNASLDPTERRCILDALATLSAEGAPPATTGAPRSGGFTSLLTIEW